MLIRNATLLGGASTDIRIAGGRIAAMARGLTPGHGETIHDAAGGAVLPGLHDHHLHLLALAASFASFDCATASSATAMARGLRAAAQGRPNLRAVNYHEHIAGPIGRAWLDEAVPNVPVRVQHRSGRLWICNSAALRELARPGEPTPFETVEGVCTGRLYDDDSWVRGRMDVASPDLSPVGAALARCGVTGVTDATPANDAATCRILAQAQVSGAIRQRIAIMGTAEMANVAPSATLFPIAVKLHLHEDDYPEPEAFFAMARAARAAGLGMAVHCVTEADLVFTLSLLEECGMAAQARIEHASIVPPHMIGRLAKSGITVVTQPNFILERGDAYRHDVAVEDHPNLYRCATLKRAGVKIAGGTDAPFGGYDPWAAMHAATQRRTRAGHALGRGEIVSPEHALALFTTPLRHPGGAPRCVEIGQPADLCLLQQPWRAARQNLAGVTVQATLRAGELIYTNTANNAGQRNVA